MIRAGIVGGGQLARMLTQAGHRMGLEIWVLDPEEDSPAAQVGAKVVVGDWSSPQHRAEFAAQVDFITLENEFVEHQALRAFEELGVPVRPRPKTLAIVQDKLRQKVALQEAGLAVPRFEPVATAAEVVAAGDRLGWPLVLKARRNGYDGKGNATLASADDAPAAFERLGLGNPDSLMVEAYVPYLCELAVIAVRGADGAIATYDPVLTIQEEHICRFVVAPSGQPESVQREATRAASVAVHVVEAIGVVGVELFLHQNGSVLVNELAPRPHNTGHLSIDACVTSQFENHWRAVLGWPLGSTRLLAPAAMANLLGERNGTADLAGLAEALSAVDSHVHFYGKREVRRGRKMGHITALGQTPDQALERARKAMAAVRI